MTRKSSVKYGNRPDWYLNQSTHQLGDYFGSLSSIFRGETYVTQDLRHIVHRAADGEINVSRNACAHAGAPLFTQTGEHTLESIQCPLHKWRYKPSGTLTHAPYFEEALCRQVRLKQMPFGIWNGYILGYRQTQLDISLKGFGKELHLPLECVDPRKFDYLEEYIDDVPYPRELMMVNYLDGYHVPLCHQKTFDAVVDSSTYEWELSPLHGDHSVGYSIQMVRAKRDMERHIELLMRRENCPAEQLGWADLHLWLRANLPNFPTPIDRDIFAVWGAVYGHGHLMIELYEGGLFMAVSSLVNVDPDNLNTRNKNPVEFYVHESVPRDVRDVVKRKFMSAYKQSADEDTELCKTLWAAHRLGGTDFDRIYHEHLEKGDVHWREWFLKHFVSQR